MHPILFKIGSSPIYAYTALLDLGILLGIVISCLEGRRRGQQVETVLDAALWGVVGGILGGRLGYIIPNWSQYAAQPWAILRVWGGGLAFHGALIGGTLGVALYAALRFPSFWELADLAALGIPLGQALGWLGALLHGSNYGRVSYGAWAWELPDLYGIVVRRLPTQAVGSGVAALIFVLLLIIRRRRFFPGALFLLYVLVNSLAFFFLEFTRGDKSLYWGPLRASQVMYLWEAIVSLSLLVYLRKKGAIQPNASPEISEEENRSDKDGSGVETTSEL